MSRSAEELRAKRREYDRRYKAGPASGVRVADVNKVIPENIERRESHEPCFRCGTAHGCKHRPWVVARSAA